MSQQPRRPLSQAAPEPGAPLGPGNLLPAALQHRDRQPGSPEGSWQDWGAPGHSQPPLAHPGGKRDKAQGGHHPTPAVGWGGDR